MTVAVERTQQLTRVKSGEEKIYVTVRVRPLSSKEVARSDVSDWECTNDNTVVCTHAVPERSLLPATYTFDRVFGPECQTQRVYEEGAKDVALSALTGLNSTIFAYGQTSSGKTYTMRGVTESAIADIFAYIKQNPDREFVLKVSALEIYNEVVKDLLSSDSNTLRLLDDKERGTIVEKLKEEVVRDVDHLRQVLKICEAQRQVGETSLNDMSSRSHQIIRLTVESQKQGIASGAPATSLVASLNFVDLAGSERASQTQADGARLKEGAHINRSLLTLSTCIRKLSGGSKTKGGHIPYRDSKLTRILQHSLGGNARTAIICTMSPAHSHVEQSRNTLAFATRAKEVTNTAHINMVVSDKVLVKQLQKEVARLEAELKMPEGAVDCTSSEALLQAKDLQIQKMEEELKELQKQRDAAQARLDEVSRKLEAEEDAKKQTEEVAKKCAEEVIKRKASKTPGSQPTVHTPLTNRRRWSDSGDYLVRKMEQNQNPQTPPTTIRTKGSNISLRQSSAASLMLVQEIRKLENLQDELGEDANRALVALQKEVECLRLAQAGMNHDAASTMKKLQDEIHTMHNVRATSTEIGGAEKTEDIATLRESISLNRVTLRQELSRLGEKDKTDADAAIATLEEQLESVQRSLDKMVLDNHANSPKEAGDSPKTPMRKKKNVPLTPQGSCTRQRLTADTPCSPAVRRSLMYNNENNENTPPRVLRENSVSNAGENASPHVNGHQKQGASPAKSGDISSSQCSKESPGGAHKRSNSVDIRKMQNMFKTAAEDNIKSIRTYVTELKERVAKLQYQKQLLVCQVLELEANGSEEEEMEGGEEPNEDQLALQPVNSPGSWRSEFEQQRAHILELWDMCHVSIIHRTQFYLLFNGDPADAIYMEVELRRLTWLQEHLTPEPNLPQSNVNAPEEHLLPASPLSNSSRSLKRERDLLAKRMRGRLCTEEREDLYKRWGIPVDAKQRKLQLVHKLWTDPHNMSHIQASAQVVARIVGILNPGSASKEMFELNFAPPTNSERPHMFGWNGLSALLNF